MHNASFGSYCDFKFFNSFLDFGPAHLRKLRTQFLPPRNDSGSHVRLPNIFADAPFAPPLRHAPHRSRRTCPFSLLTITITLPSSRSTSQFAGLSFCRSISIFCFRVGLFSCFTTNNPLYAHRRLLIFVTFFCSGGGCGPGSACIWS